MNRIAALVRSVETHEGVSVVTFDAGGTGLRMMGLGTSLKADDAVVLGVRASQVALAKGPVGELSVSNRLPCTVESVTTGTLLCRVNLRFGTVALESVVTRASAERMRLAAGDAVTALIKASDLSVLETRGGDDERR